MRQAGRMNMLNTFKINNLHIIKAFIKSILKQMWVLAGIVDVYNNRLN